MPNNSEIPLEANIAFILFSIKTLIALYSVNIRFPQPVHGNSKYES